MSFLLQILAFILALVVGNQVGDAIGSGLVGFISFIGAWFIFAIIAGLFSGLLQIVKNMFGGRDDSRGRIKSY